MVSRFYLTLARCFRLKRVKYLVWPIVGFLFLFLYFEVTFPVRYIFKHSNVNSSCVIPRPDPFDPSILKFVWEPKPLKCERTPPIIYSGDDSIIQFNQSAIKELNLNENEISCTYRKVLRNEDDVTIAFSSATEFTPPFRMNSDFYHVTCHKPIETVIFDQLITGASPLTNEREVPVKEESLDNPSVLMFGLDSVARSAAIRKMPKTLKYLTETLGSYDLKGYMKVGENTLPNLLPILTGRRAWTDEFKNTDYANNPYDDFPFLWKDYEKQGYATLYAEDMPKFSTFNYLTRGFIKPPTTHYMRPLWLAIQELEKVRSKLGPVFLYLENKKLNVQDGSTMCYKSKPRHKLFVDYLKQYITQYTKKRKFMFSFMAELCHEYPNFLSYGDDDFLEFMKWLKEGGHLDNSILILFSDHGARIDEIRNTYIGRIEVRMPIMHIVLPQKIKDKFPNAAKNLAINTERLSVPFDLHQTLADILHNKFDDPSKLFINNKLRGISLFQPLPIDRSCANAWIPDNFCACYTSTSINASTSELSKVLGDKLITDLNSKLSSQPKCSQLTLNKVQDIHYVSDGLEHQKTENSGISIFQFFTPEEKPEQRYDISIETIPGNAIFEATYVVKGSDIKLVGDIVRVNKYRGQADCIKEKLLQPMCYCA